MNRYLVTSPTRPDSTVEADDFDTSNGLLIFRDEIGRATVAVALEDGLRVDVEYGEDPRFPLRERLAELRRAADGKLLEQAIDDLENPKPAPRAPTARTGQRQKGGR